MYFITDSVKKYFLNGSSVDPDQTVPLELFDQGLHCLNRYVCPHD